MPQLPSGRKAGIDPTLVGEMVQNPLFHLGELGRITEIAALYSYLRIVEFMESDTSRQPKIEIGESSKNTHEIANLEPVFQNFTVADVIGGKTHWPAQDVTEFETWINSSQIQRDNKIVLEEVLKAKTSVIDHVNALAFTDIDPNQDEAERFRRAAVYVDAATRIPKS